MLIDQLKEVRVFKTMHLLLILLIFVLSTSIFCEENYTLKSPDEKITVNFEVSSAGEAFYSVYHTETQILNESKLGLVRSDEDFSKGLTLQSVSDVIRVSDTYTLLHGKRLNCSYSAHKRIFNLENSNKKKIAIIFQVSDDGIAFRYYFPDKTEKRITIFREVTHFILTFLQKLIYKPVRRHARVGILPNRLMRNIIRWA